jgi:predicted small lipoprotein YifL
MKKILAAISAVLAILILTGCGDAKNDALPSPDSVSPAPTQATHSVEPASLPAPQESAAGTQAPSPSDAVVYRNTDYGFTFDLPESWENYTIITDEWEGLAADGSAGEKTVRTGPEISIRHPAWTEETPRQDIPILVFTLAQWDELGQDKFHIGAAPIGPSELGRNSKYVFALPARYNFAFPEGYEEVEGLLQTNPLHPDENISK